MKSHHQIKGVRHPKAKIEKKGGVEGKRVEAKERNEEKIWRKAAVR